MERRPLQPGWRFKCTQQRAQVQLAEILRQGQRTPGAVRGAENEKKKMFSESRRRDRGCVLLLICLSLGKKEKNTTSVAISFLSRCSNLENFCENWC